MATKNQYVIRANDGRFYAKAGTHVDGKPAAWTGKAEDVLVYDSWAKATDMAGTLSRYESTLDPEVYALNQIDGVLNKAIVTIETSVKEGVISRAMGDETLAIERIRCLDRKLARSQVLGLEVPLAAAS